MLKNLKNSMNQYGENTKRIFEIERDNERLIADVCTTINENSEEIYKQIDDNRNYLKTFRIFTQMPGLLEDIKSQNIDDISKAKIVIELLNEIDLHNKKIEIAKDNNNSFNPFKKYGNLVKEDLKNAN